MNMALKFQSTEDILFFNPIMMNLLEKVTLLEKYDKTCHMNDLTTANTSIYSQSTASSSEPFLNTTSISMWETLCSLKNFGKGKNWLSGTMKKALSPVKVQGAIPNFVYKVSI
uniref:Uncharacterized protein n=1 Tax=Cacopsylla melanoneura TaxID=428564 RepID=A0A8D9BRP8_9HEMI